MADRVIVYVFCEGCGKEVDSSSYPEKSSLCETCEIAVKLNMSTSDYLALSPQPSNTMSSLNITAQQIQDHRAARKASGLAGCITGRPVPEMSLYGYSDVQSWRPADPMKPHCFCFDCRDLWDKDASIDLQLLKEGHKMAMWTYAELLPADQRPKKEAETPALAKPMPGGGTEALVGGWGVPLPPRTMTEHPEAYVRGVPREVFFPPPRVDTSAPAYESFEEVPTSLPAPRHRDVMNETKAERLRGDLAELRAKIQGDLVRTMDKRRRGVYYEEPDRSEYLRSVDQQENALWLKLDAVELLMKE